MKAWIEKNGLWLSLIPVLLIMIMIFCFSAQDGGESGALSGGMVAWLVERIVPGFAGMPPAQQESIRSTLGFILRKSAHFSEYALLGFFLLLHVRQIGKRTLVKVPYLWAWVVGTLYAVTDELHQMFVPGRGPAVRDVCIDSAGVAAGAALLCLILQIHTCNSNKRKL